MKFWKDHAALRIVLMVLFFVVGLALVLYGWSLTGQMTGLILMLVGIMAVLICSFGCVTGFMYGKTKKYTKNIR